MARGVTISGSLSAKMQEVAKKQREDTIKKLIADGRRLCAIAEQTKNTKVRSGDQVNAYFFIVTYNGVVKAVGNKKGADRPDDIITGRSGGHNGLKGTWWEGRGSDWWSDFQDAINKLLRSVAPNASTTVGKYDLFVLNAAFYTSWLEDGSYALGLSKIFGHPVDVKHWKVISQIRSQCEAVARKYGTKSKVEKVGIHGHPFKPASTNNYAYHYDWQEGDF